MWEKSSTWPAPRTSAWASRTTASEGTAMTAASRPRPAVKRGMALGLELRQNVDMKDPKVQAVLFGQRARAS